MNDVVDYGPLGDSEWTVSQARRMAADLREIATADTELYAADLFVALAEYVDRLYGVDPIGRTGGFDRLLAPQDRTVLAEAIGRIREQNPTGAVRSDQRPSDDQLAEAGESAEGTDDPELDVDRVVRLGQPVNAAVTLEQGRTIAADLAATEEWQAQLGKALLGLYGYLDELYGGPGEFTELLTRAECEEVAESLASSSTTGSR